MIEDYFKLGFRSLSRRRLRSWLTMIGIFIGIAAVVSLISLGQGMQDAIYESFENIGGDKLFIQPKSSFGSVGENTGRAPLTEDDVDFLRSQSGIEAISYYTMTSAKVEYQDSVRYFMIAGIPTDYEALDLMINSMFQTELNGGRNLQPGDKNTVTIGFHHNEKGLYDGKNLDVNSRFLINDQKFVVSGIFSPIGSSQDDQMILMPIDSFREVSGIEERVDFIVLQVNEGEDPIAVGEELTRSLARHRDVKEGKEDFTIQTPEDLLESFQTILDIVQAVLIGIAAISLLVGGIGIMNTMYTSVIERHKEIGIMKAIGAKNSDIFTLFLIESGFLGFVGGILGIILGTGLATMVEVISKQALGKTFLQANYSIELFAGALLFSFLVGAIAGTLPAIQASKQKPADTLRDE